MRQKTIIYYCPNCGAELDVLYRRAEFDPPRVTGRCDVCDDWRVVKTDENWVPLQSEKTDEDSEAIR